MICGGRSGARSGSRSVAEDADQFFVDDADHRLGGSERLQDILTDGALAHRGDEILDDLEVDVGFEQRPADFLIASSTSFSVRRALAGELAKRFGQAIGK